MKERTRASVIHFIQGLLMGSADVVPGISGGTVALIVGIYERLISSVRAAASAPVALVRGDLNRVRYRLREVHWGLVIPLGLGIMTALLLGARHIPGLLAAYPVQGRALFFGLIVGSLVVPWRRIRHRVGLHYLVAVAAAVIAFVLAGLPPREVLDPRSIAIFLAASIAICAMILPGVSGSYLLLVMGMYEPTLRAVDGRNLVYIGIFGLGAVIGIGIFSRVLEFLLSRYHDVTMAALVGLMVGSLRALWPWLDADRRILVPVADGTLLPAFLLALLGFVLVTLLIRIGAAADRHRRAIA
jgi:putative membrane protein